MFAQNNLELRVARAAAMEASALARQAAAYANPTLGLSHEPLSDGELGYSESYFNLSQRLEWPATRTARTAAATRLADAARARLAADSARLAWQVKQTYVETARTEQVAALLARVTTVFRNAEQSAATRLEEGDISTYERRRIGVERVRYEAALAEAELEVSAMRRTLASLIAPETDRPALTPADSFDTPPPIVEPAGLLAASLARRSEIVAAQADVDAAHADATLSRRERVPAVTATGGYKRQSDGLTGAFLGLSIPLPFRDRRGGAIDAADARVNAAAARFALVQRQVRNDVNRALEAYESYRRRAALLASSMSAETADLLTIAQVSYEAGEMDLIELLDAADALREAQALEARFRAGFWTSYFDLERAVGGFTSADAPDMREDT
ncbi:hypothetical protein BH23GEM10_BH23GEM10_17130 [soil metagenome]